MTLSQLIAAFCAAQAARGLAAVTVETYRQRLEFAAQTFRARGCIGAPTAEDFDAVLQAARDDGRSRHALHNLRSVLRRFGRWLHTRGHTERDPAVDLQATDPLAEELPPAPLSEAEVSTLLDAIPRETVLDLRNRAHLELLYGCGLRLGESVALSLDDLDLGQATVRIDGKGGSERLMPLLPVTLRALEDYLALRRTLLRGPDLGRLFLGRYGRPLAAAGFRDWLTQHTRETLGRRIHPHLLRHSAAVHLLRGGADIRHVQAFLGHADIDTTKIYLRLVPGHLKADYEGAMPWLG